jgi:hypothetical protein
MVRKNFICLIILASIDNINKILEGLNADLTKATDDYNALISEWNRKEANFNDIMERLKKDIKVLGECLDYLNSLSH